MRSAIGSVGMMQINEKVWRGVYDLGALRNDVVYNVRAGSEILIHYLVDYAIAKREDEVTGEKDNLARATYSAYNAGPGQLRRYRSDKKSRLAARIDESFWDKYRSVKAGRDLEVARCFGVEVPAQ
jgi:soluble lytic murein transglycosylase-like protein